MAVSYYFWKRETRCIIQCVWEETVDLLQVNWQPFSHRHIGPSRIRTDAGWRWEVSWYETDALTTRPRRPLFQLFRLFHLHTNEYLWFYLKLRFCGSNIEIYRICTRKICVFLFQGFSIIWLDVKVCSLWIIPSQFVTDSKLEIVNASTFYISFFQKWTFLTVNAGINQRHFMHWITIYFNYVSWI
jgi:hypothetical protein